MRTDLFAVLAVSCALFVMLACASSSAQTQEGSAGMNMVVAATDDPNLRIIPIDEFSVRVLGGVSIPRLVGSHTDRDWAYEVTCEPGPSVYEAYGISLSYMGRRISGEPGDIVYTPWGLLKCNQDGRWVCLWWYSGLIADDFRGKRDLTPCSKDAIQPAEHPTEDEIIEDCIRILREHRKYGCGEAMSVLRHKGSKAASAVPYLVNILRKEYDLSLIYPNLSPNTNRAIECLGFIGHGAKDAMPVLLEYTDHRDPNLRSALVWALFRISPQSEGTRNYIGKALNDESERVRAAAESAADELQKLDDAEKPHSGDQE